VKRSGAPNDPALTAAAQAANDPACSGAISALT